MQITTMTPKNGIEHTHDLTELFDPMHMLQCFND
jgi:hypothetical protein